MRSCRGSRHHVCVPSEILGRNNGCRRGAAAAAAGREHPRAVPTRPLSSSSPATAGRGFPPSQPFEEEKFSQYDPRHFYPAFVGENLSGYRLLSKLGWGTGSTVWLAAAPGSWLPWRKREYVVLKITNCSVATRAAANRELDILQHILSTRTSHPGRQYVRKIRGSFEVAGPGGKKHLCLAFEPVRQPLWTLSRQVGRSGEALSRTLKTLLPSILQCLDYLHTECHVIHTDLKGDHFMLPFEDPEVLESYVRRQELNPAPPSTDRNGRRIYASRSEFGRLRKDIDHVKLTDFGLAVRGDVCTKHNHDIQPVEYTAPEVMLKSGWTYSADIWNLGLVLWELLADMNLLDGRTPGSYLFSFETRFAQIIRLLGPPPPELLSRASTEAYSRLYGSQGVFRYPDLVPGESFDFERKTPKLVGQDKALFITFAKRMLAWLPEDRATARELLDDPWLKHFDP